MNTIINKGHHTCSGGRLAAPASGHPLGRAARHPGAGARPTPAAPPALSQGVARGAPPAQQAAAPAGPPARARAGPGAGPKAYPFIDASYPGIELVHAEPPVYVVHGFLSERDCEALIAAAEGGALDGLDYENAVLLDTHKLWPLLLVVAAGTAFDTLHGAGAAGGLGAALADPSALLPAAGLAAARWAALVGGLLAAVHLGMRGAIGGRVFTGTKWTVANLFGGDAGDAGDARGAGGAAAGGSGLWDGRQRRQDGKAAAAAGAAARFVGSASALLRVPAAHLEPPTVTRYRDGQQQRVQFDGRPAGDPSGLQAFLAAGGQRLVQVVCYLRTLDPSEGGGTKFDHPLLGGLNVRPRRGQALVFFPAFEDGSLDGRMAHSGQPVAGAGAEKWIVNTWACQRPVPSAVRVGSAAAEEEEEGKQGERGRRAGAVARAR